jgi:hypothetical protein
MIDFVYAIFISIGVTVVAVVIARQLVKKDDD